VHVHPIGLDVMTGYEERDQVQQNEDENGQERDRDLLLFILELDQQPLPIRYTDIGRSQRA
jgi:hypothetical protein